MSTPSSPLPRSFFRQDVLTVAPALLGKKLVRQFDNGQVIRGFITETEAYRGEEDLACHARFGRTKRTEVMYAAGGKVYVYLIYGIYWMLNIVTGLQDQPQAVLIRALELPDGTKISGPGKLGKLLQLDQSFYSEDLSTSTRLWISKGVNPTLINTSKRVGIDYAGEWANKLWRWQTVITDLK